MNDAVSLTMVAEHTLVSAFLAQVAERPDKPCLIFAERHGTHSYGQVADAALRHAGRLRQAGVRPGDIVMIFLGAHPDAYASFLGAMLMGAVPSFMPPPSPKQDPGKYWRDHAALLARTTPRAILTDAATAQAIEASGMLDGQDVALVRTGDAAAALPRSEIVSPGPDALAFLQHSSGTTGLKKGVMIRHRAAMAQIFAYGRQFDATEADVIASWLPIYHDLGLISSTLLPLTLGLSVVVLDPFAWASRPAALLEAISAHRATLVWQPNFAFEHLIRTVPSGSLDADLSCVRAFVSTAEPCRPATFARFAAHFAANGVRLQQLQSSYGMAETVLAITQTPMGQVPHSLEVSVRALRDEGRASPALGGEPVLAVMSNGKAIDGMTVCAVDAAGGVCEDLQVGEMLVQGACLFDGYFRLPEQTAERLTAQGLRTREMGFMLDGEVYILGRMDDLIIVHGRNFYAGEVETALNRLDGVKPGRVVAFGIDNAAVGSQDVVVVAEAEPGADPRELSRRIKRAVLQDVGLDLYEARIVEPGWLSKTTSGKVSREGNRTRYLAEKAAGPSSGKA